MSRTRVRSPRGTSVVAALVVALVASALVAGSAGAATTTGAVSKGKVVALTSTQLSAALLTQGDMPPTWVPLTTPPPTTAAGLCGGPTSAARATSIGSTASASITYTADPNEGPNLNLDLYAFPSVTLAQRFVKETAKAVRSCDSYQNPVPGGDTLTISLSPIRVRTGADQAFAFQQVISAPQRLTSGQTVLVKAASGDVVYARRANVILGVRLAGASIGNGAALTYLHKQLQRLDRVRNAASGSRGRHGVPTTVDAVSTCRAVVDGLTAPAAGTGQDPVQMIRDDRLVTIGRATPTDVPLPTGLVRYLTPDMYLAGTPVPDPATWRAAMTDDHFVVAEALGYQEQSGASFGAEALQFGSTDMAADFQRRTLDASCASGHVSRMAAIGTIPAAVVFERTDGGTSPYRASFVVGAFVVHLNICECYDSPDLLAVARNWAVTVAEQLGVEPHS